MSLQRRPPHFLDVARLAGRKQPLQEHSTCQVTGLAQPFEQARRVIQSAISVGFKRHIANEVIRSGLVEALRGEYRRIEGPVLLRTERHVRSHRFIQKRSISDLSVTPDISRVDPFRVQDGEVSTVRMHGVLPGLFHVFIRGRIVRFCRIATRCHQLLACSESLLEQRLSVLRPLGPGRLSLFQ